MPQIGEVRKGKEIDSKRTFDKFIWRACRVCGVGAWVRFTKGQPESTRCLSCANREIDRSREKNPNWHGPRYVDSRGYIKLRLEPNDPFYSMADVHHRVYEHRLIMAQYLNRPLESWELVHHKDGNKHNNLLLNLELLNSQSKHYAMTVMAGEIKRLQDRVSVLEQRVIILEAENVLLKLENIEEVI